MEIATCFVVFFGIAAFLAFPAILKGFYIINQYERGIVFRLGRVEQSQVREPGLTFVFPFVDRLVKIDIRTVTLDVPPQEVITKDNVTIKVNAVVYFHVQNPVDAVIRVANYYSATSLYAQTTLRNILGQHELDEVLAERTKIADSLEAIIDKKTDEWGIKVTAVEIKDIELPAEMQRAMARQAEAERERRAKIIAADGEHQSAQRLQEAASVLAQTPEAMQLRYLQTLLEIGVENSTTVVFPLPIELTTGFQKILNRRNDAG
ncbi:MAG: slipin family protein [Polyangiales bacterium]|nr:slipin family protein [Myxococcales bacterium]